MGRKQKSTQQTQTRCPNGMKTMTLDEVKNLPPLTEERLNEIKNFQNTDFSDCPKQTKEDLKQFRPYYELHTKSQKTKTHPGRHR